MKQENPCKNYYVLLATSSSAAPINGILTEICKWGSLICGISKPYKCGFRFDKLRSIFYGLIFIFIFVFVTFKITLKMIRW